MRKKIVYLLMAAFTVLQAGAQNLVTVSGIVSDSVNTQPLKSATVSLKNKNGKIYYEITTGKGVFTITGIPTDVYAVTVEHTSYKTLHTDSVLIYPDMKPMQILLSQDEKMLKGVTVTSSVPFITQTADKITLNVAASPVAAGGTAYDVLLRAPGVVEQNNSFQFRSKTVNVLIDGRPSNLSGEDLKNFLSAMPANGIEKVEILPNPSAKYDAQGGSVINIKLAKNKNFGTNGTLTAGLGAGRWGRYNSGISLNHRNKKLNMYGSYDYMYNKQYYDNYSDRVVSSDLHIIEKEYDTRTRNNHSAKLGLDYDLNKKISIGFLAKGFMNYRDRKVENTSLLDITNSSVDSSSFVTTNGKARFISPSVNLYLKSILDSSGKELSINADYFNYTKRWSDDYITRFYDEKGAEYAPANLLRDNSPFNNEVTSFSADYIHPAKKARWEAGLKTAITKTDNDVLWQFQDADNWKTDAGKSNRFIYKEYINAAYVNFSKQIKKYSLQLGLRAEQTNSTGQSVTLNQETKKSYANLFPNVSIQYAASPIQQWGFTYRKAIQRFSFDVVNPFIVYQSQYAYSQGNPDIKPMIMHNIGVSHIWKYQLFTNLGYTYIKDAISPVYLQDDATKSIISTVDNLSSANVFTANITWMKSLAKGKWTSTNTMGGFYAKYNSTGDDLEVQNAKVTGYYSTSNQVKFNKKWTGEFTGFYYSPIASGVYQQKSYYGISMGIAKEILKKKGSLKLNVKDIFNTQEVRYDVSYQNVNTYYRNKAESRFINLVFSYKFGNTNVKASKNRKTGIEEERGRMGAN